MILGSRRFSLQLQKLHHENLLPPLPPARTLKKTLGNKNTTDLLCSLADLSGMLQHRRRIRAVVRSAAPRGKAAVGGWGFDGGAAALLAEPAAVLAGAEPAGSFSPPLYGRWLWHGRAATYNSI